MKVPLSEVKMHEEASSAAELVFTNLRENAVTANRMATWIREDLGGSTGVMGPSLYAGTAGVAWALAIYARAGGGAWAADLARAALLHSIRYASTIAVTHRLGFHGGMAGIAFAAAEVGRLLDDSTSRNYATELLVELAKSPASDEFDVISGAAGTVLAGALLGQVYESAAIRPALMAANQLRVRAKRSKRNGQPIATWSLPNRPRALPLTGLAHGVSGVAWCLLELYRVLPGESWLRDLADLAFSYESTTYNIRSSGWPDLRHYHSWQATVLLAPPHQVVWCHGAGGIALARLRAFLITGNAVHSEVAQRAAESLDRALTSDFEQDQLDYGLCHGLAGKAECLELVSRLWGPSVSNSTAAATRCVASVLRKNSFDDYSLMLGVAGLGSFLLKRSGRSAESILLPGLSAYLSALE